MTLWAKSEIDRSQPQLMAPSLDERIGEDHGIRLLEELLRELDWSEWEAAYSPGGAGRPPIHPRLMAGAVLYGLLKKIRSTRDLEEATRMRLDFQWLLEGRSVDHTTFATFKQRFDDKIEALFKQINRRAAQLRKATLEEVMIDGSRLRANSDRHGARTAKSLKRRLEQLEERVAQRLAELESEGLEEDDAPVEAAENAELELEGSEAGGADEPSDPYEREGCQDLKAERDKLQAALEEARRRDQIKKTKDGSSPKGVRVPVTDVDSHILPNKEGGYAPNYTPVVAVEREHGLIVSATIAEGHSEAATVPALIEGCAELQGQAPKRVSFDSNFASGKNLHELSRAGVEVYSALGTPATNPALRPDGREPVEQSRIGDLPKRGKQFDKAAFIYDAPRDLYWCPAGRKLTRERTLRRANPEQTFVRVTEYRCRDCSGCPLASQCLGRKATTRRVSRDEHEPLREELAERMRGDAAKEIYRRRAPVVEGTIGTIKSAMGVRRFLRRGKRKVQADWIWTCAAYNLGKLLRSAVGASQRIFGLLFAPLSPQRASLADTGPVSSEIVPLPFLVARDALPVARMR